MGPVSIPCSYRGAGVLAAAALLVVAWGCADECPPVRCGIVPPLLLTVRDGASGAALPDADVAVTETPSDFVVRGCETAGSEFDCTHEVLGIGGHDDLRRNAEGVEPGYGPWKSHATHRRGEGHGHR